MLVGTEADVIVVELGFTALSTSKVICRDFPTFSNLGPGAFDIGKKARKSNKLGKIE